MKKTFLFALAILLSVSLFGCTSLGNNTQSNKEGQPQDKQQQTDVSDEAAVTSLVENFGSKLQTVSLLAPKDIVNKSIQENYGGFVSPTLLAEWQSDPQNAPGRLTSSPWPDHIKIETIKKLSEYEYEVKGEIIEITSTEKVNGGVAAQRQITLKIKKTGERWLIDSATLGVYAEANSIVYRNTNYGFNFSLPESWKGYSIVADKWEGNAFKDPQSGKIVETGPMISIRHPDWTSQNPRQDIPIMIFTLAQWNILQQGEFHIGAAPINPSELGRNTSYVFALPARYNYAFLPGYEEVENILKSNPFQANE
ncbi:MAG: hypothetical protein A4E55_00939 [Pelotomaculum sp. PtaU1.Bin035]|nr:MAG: hypothetical protein A4E55_00939 [Pelotomaculum sp. PtaU1.Bin035]